MTRCFNTISLFLLLSFTIFLSPSHAQKVNTQNKLLWKIEGNGLKKPSYLFGTMHVKDERAFHLSDTVFIGISQTDVFAAEIDMDNILSQTLRMFFDKDTSEYLKHKLSAEEYDELDTKIRNKMGVGLENINSKETWMLKWMVKDYDYDQSDTQRETFLDAYLFNLAKKLKKQTVGLETLEDYSKLNKDEDLEMQLKSLMQQTEQTSSQEDFQKILSMYEQGDIEVIDDFRKSFPREFSRELLLRNINMANRMDSILKTKSMFVAMGCAHLPGDSGMIDLLRKKGYKLSPVTAVYSGVDKKYKYNTVEYNWKEYTAPSGMFSLDAPGNVDEFPVNTFDMVNMQLYLCPDIYRNTFFMTITMNIEKEISPDKEEDVLNTFAHNMSKKGTYQTVSKKIVVENGKKKLYVTYKTQKNTYNSYVIMLQGSSIVIGNVSGDKKAATDEYAKRFLSSIKILKTPVRIDPTLEMRVDSLGAYGVLIPKGSKSNKQNIASESGNVEMRMNYTTFPYHGNLFYATWYLYTDGQYIEDDSVSLNIMRENIVKSHQEVVKEKFFDYKEKYHSLEMETIYKTDLYARLFFTIKGNRIYLFMLSSDKKDSIYNESANNFFNSITLRDFIYSNPGHTYAPADSSFKITVFNEPSADSIVSAYRSDSYDQKLTYYIFNDKASSAAYVIKDHLLSPYYTVDSAEKFMNELLLMEVDTTKETIIDRKITETADSLVLTCYTQSKSKDKKMKRYKNILYNDHVYSLAMASLEEDLKSVHGEKFFNSFIITNPQKAEKNKIDKTEKLLNDLMSGDSAKRTDASYALDIATYKEKHLPLMKKAIVYDYAEKDVYVRMNYQLMQTMQANFSKEYPAIVKELYLAHKDDAKLQCELLSSMTENMNDSAYFYIYLELLSSAPPAANEFESCPVSIARYSESTYSADLVRPYLQLMEKEEYRPLLLNSMGSFSDTSIVIKQEIAAHYDQLAGYMKNDVVPSLLAKEQSDKYESYKMVLLIDLFPKDKKAEWYQQLLKSNDKYIVFEAMLYRIKNDIAVDPSLINKYASDMHYVYYLHKNLQGFNKLAAYPKDKFTAKNIAIGSVVACLTYEDVHATQAIAVGEREIFLNGKKVKAFLIKYKEESSKKWYVAIAAPEDIELPVDLEKDTSYFNNSYASSEEYSSKNASEQFDGLIEILKEKEEKQVE